MEGEGCCGCELAAMTIQTGVERDDILFLSTDNEVNYLTLCLFFIVLSALAGRQTIRN